MSENKPDMRGFAAAVSAAASIEGGTLEWTCPSGDVVKSGDFRVWYRTHIERDAAGHMLHSPREKWLMKRYERHLMVLVLENARVSEVISTQNKVINGLVAEMANLRNELNALNDISAEQEHRIEMMSASDGETVN